MPKTTNVSAHRVTFGEATKVWARIAALSFGGTAGQITVMHRLLVEEKRWVGEPALLGCAALGVVIYQAGFA